MGALIRVRLVFVKIAPIVQFWTLLQH